MRIVAGLLVAGTVSVCAAGAMWMRSPASPPPAQQAAAQPVAPKAPAPKADLKPEAPADITASIPEPKPAPAKSTCANPDALGVSRTVVIDTTGGPGFGFLQYKQMDFLTDKEVVLTFDDGPWPTTPSVLKSLAEECTKATFFPIGLHSTYHPEILRQVAAAGHTIGAHTWSHAHLDSKKLNEAQVKEEVEKGFSAIKLALGANPAPFFRFPALQHTPAAMTYLGSRNIATFSCDIDSFDFKAKDAAQIVNTVMTKLDKQGKGIILMHDLQKHTAEALPTLLRRLKAGGYKVVQMKAKAQLETLAEYDAGLAKDLKLPAIASRPVSSVVQTVND